MELFADKLLYRKNWHTSTYSMYAFDSFAPKMYQARVISLDDHAAKLAHDLSLKLDLLEIHNNLRFLRLPSERIWVEMSRRAFFGNPTLEKGRVGYLLERTTETGFRISMIEEMIASPDDAILPVVVSFNFDSDFEKLDQENPMKLTHRQKMRYCFGFGYTPDKDGLDFEVRWLTQHTDVRFLSDFYAEQYRTLGAESAFFETLNEVSGTVRHILAIVLLMHFPPVTFYSRKQQQGRRIINGQSRPYLKVEDLQVAWPKRKPVNVLRWVKSELPKDPVHKRAHDVDGHWRRLRPLTEEELDALGKPRSLLAPHEFYKHTWVRDHQRGDAKLGFVHKRKHVVANENLISI